MAELPKIILDCTAEQSTRYALANPWSHDGMIYATDGRIIARMPGECDGDKGPDSTALGWERDKYDETPTPLPQTRDAPYEDVEDCSICGGSQICICAACEHEHECPCIGNPPRNVDPLPVGSSAHAAYWYVNILNSCGVREVFLHKEKPESRPMRFEFDGGGEGLLMPTKGPNAT